MTKYTVLLLRPDYLADEFGKDTYMAHIEAEDVSDAEDKAKWEAATLDQLADHDYDADYDPADYAVLCVIEGHHMDIKTA